VEQAKSALFRHLRDFTPSIVKAMMTPIMIVVTALTLIEKLSARRLGMRAPNIVKAIEATMITAMVILFILLLIQS
jgi:hypothetical protein